MSLLLMSVVIVSFKVAYVLHRDSEEHRMRACLPSADEWIGDCGVISNPCKGLRAEGSQVVGGPVEVLDRFMSLVYQG